MPHAVTWSTSSPVPGVGIGNLGDLELVGVVQNGSTHVPDSTTA